MSNAAKHRKKAAEFEQLKQIDRAIASYVRAIEESELAGEDVDVALLNKVGDLALRQRRVTDAITYYERAVEHYANSGLFNNAIALCNKILRNAPGRANVYFTLGRICARKGLRGDATRNFLEYATRMQEDGRTDERMRAFAEIADLMPDLPEVRRLLDEDADQAGIVLPRRRTPSMGTVALVEESATLPPPRPSPAPGAGPTRGKSQDLIYLEVSYRTPLLQQAVAMLPLPMAGADSAHLDHAPTVPQSALLTPSAELGELPPPDTTGMVAAPDPSPSASEHPEGFELLDDYAEAGAVPLQWLTVAEPAPTVAPRASFRIDPHDFILHGELLPLVLDDALVEAGLHPHGPGQEDGADHETAWSWEDSHGAVAEHPAERTEPAEDVRDSGTVGVPVPAEEPQLAAPQWGARPMMVTPALPIAAVAAESTLIATSRRDTLRSAVARSPQDWLLRRRLAEALFEAGERYAGLAELEAAQQGLIAEGDLQAASDLADTLVRVAPERIAFHQKRVELSVRLKDRGRLRMAYVDLADALVLLGEENRARAVYARVLEIDPFDDRARGALGSAAPPLPPGQGSEGPVVEFASWRGVDGTASTRMRMREPAMSGDEDADFAALLRNFKEGIAHSLGEDDYESHYDLGVAYKEMGLLDDAIEEFQKALRSRSHRLPAYEALGQCFMEQGRHQIAVTVLTRALHEPEFDDALRVGVLYLLAYSCEALQRWEEARSYYQRVDAIDTHFRDAAARLAALDQVAR